MADSSNDRSDTGLSYNAVHDVMLALQSGAVNRNVSGVGDADSDRVWSLSSGEMLCCYQFTVTDDDDIRSPSCTYRHQHTGHQRTAIQCLSQPTVHVYRLGVWRRARP